MTIFLIGYMGCGKTTLGRMLSDYNYFRFIDMDEYIEQKHEMSINEIFATYGEDTFRRYEREALEELSRDADVVLATGGGAPCFFDNMEFMNSCGTSVYIEMSADTLTRRLLKAQANRPLLKDKSEEELLAFVTDMLRKREPFYQKATFTLNNDSLTATQATDRLIAMLGQ